MQNWLERAVIGLNLCPFAKAVHVRQQIRWVVSSSTHEAELLEELRSELALLVGVDPQQIDTTMLVHPAVLNDFIEFNGFLGKADRALISHGLGGILQIASFHPDYCFSGALQDDVGNFSNRAPYPTLHLLREQSVQRAVLGFPDSAQIYQRNIATLDALGVDGWRKLWPG